MLQSEGIVHDKFPEVPPCNAAVSVYAPMQTVATNMAIMTKYPNTLDDGLLAHLEREFTTEEQSLFCDARIVNDRGQCSTTGCRQTEHGKTPYC